MVEFMHGRTNLSEIGTGVAMILGHVVRTISNSTASSQGKTRECNGYVCLHFNPNTSPEFRLFWTTLPLNVFDNNTSTTNRGVVIITGMFPCDGWGRLIAVRITRQVYPRLYPIAFTTRVRFHCLRNANHSKMAA